ncbi:hypothetical protein BaRGS_00019638 [Batillaria attramentaria]|uniref:Uncharacterized protein n=1 Tax=Batillaria attramentaria TaxID=370345 RepID=A0ABD0KPS7_9CAEN
MLLSCASREASLEADRTYQKIPLPSQIPETNNLPVSFHNDTSPNSINLNTVLIPGKGTLRVKRGVKSAADVDTSGSRKTGRDGFGRAVC